MDEHQSKLEPDLIVAYKNTLFQANVSDEVITLRVGQQCPALQTVFEQHNVKTACYITAHNPFGRLLTKPENDDRNARMRTKLVCVYPIFDGVGVDPNGEWEGEASFLALGASKDVSLALAEEWEQNAVVFVDETLTVSLLFTR
jgi:hypothetical protein